MARIRTVLNERRRKWQQTIVEERRKVGLKTWDPREDDKHWKAAARLRLKVDKNIIERRTKPIQQWWTREREKVARPSSAP